MKKLIALLFAFPLALSLSVPAFARRHYNYKEHAYYGDISASNCETHHNNMPGALRKCTLESVSHGAKYVFVTRGKVLVIANQKMPELEKYAGEHVRVMGTRTPDGKGITIANMRAARRRKRKGKS